MAEERREAAASGVLRVALNAQINPDQAGGTESSVLSMVRAFEGERCGVRLTVLAHRGFYQEMVAAAGEGRTVVRWPFPEYGPVTSVLRGRLSKLRNRLGPLGPGMDLAVKGVRALKVALRTPSAPRVDRLLRRLGVSAVHFGYPFWFDTGLPFLYEPQDLQHRHHPEFFSAEELHWRDRVYGTGCRRARFVVCGTRWTKADIQSEFGVPPERVAVIPRSSVRARTPLAAGRQGEILASLGLERPFMLYPAVTFPHKNHLRLLQALAALRDEGRLAADLVCTGRFHAPHQPRIEAEVTRLGLEPHARFPGSVSEEVLTALYHGARFVVFPSLFEGLSQSLLEAMANGVPIVGAEQSSIPETVGSAGLFFDGTDVRSIRDALRTAMWEPELLAGLRHRTGDEMKRFGWERAVPTFAACFKEAAGLPLGDEERRLIREAVT